MQHAVLPTRLPLKRFYEELVSTQAVINRKHMGLTALREVAGVAARLAMRGQTNFLRMLWKFGSVYNRDRQCNDHLRPVTYQMRPPALAAAKPRARDLFVHRVARPDMAPRSFAPRSAARGRHRHRLVDRRPPLGVALVDAAYEVHVRTAELFRDCPDLAVAERKLVDRQ